MQLRGRRDERVDDDGPLQPDDVVGGDAEGGQHGGVGAHDVAAPVAAVPAQEQADVGVVAPRLLPPPQPGEPLGHEVPVVPGVLVLEEEVAARPGAARARSASRLSRANCGVMSRSLSLARGWCSNHLKDSGSRVSPAGDDHPLVQRDVAAPAAHLRRRDPPRGEDLAAPGAVRGDDTGRCAAGGLAVDEHLPLQTGTSHHQLAACLATFSRLGPGLLDHHEASVASYPAHGPAQLPAHPRPDPHGRALARGHGPPLGLDAGRGRLVGRRDDVPTPLGDVPEQASGASHRPPGARLGRVDQGGGGGAAHVHRVARAQHDAGARQVADHARELASRTLLAPAIAEGHQACRIPAATRLISCRAPRASTSRPVTAISTSAKPVPRRSSQVRNPWRRKPSET